jgi:transcription-repair coupling factor (superfamily II helicase)
MKKSNNSLFNTLAFNWDIPGKLNQKLQEENSARLISGFTNSGNPYLVAEMIKKGWNKIVYILPSEHKNQEIIAQIETSLSLNGIDDFPIHLLPEISRTPFDELPLHSFIQCKRAAATEAIYDQEKFILILPAVSIRWGLIAPEVFRQKTIILQKGQRIDHEEIAERLVNNGYVRRQIVSEPGEFAIRGYIMDFFSPHSNNPARIELFDTEIESVKTFDISNQRSGEAIDTCKLIPVKTLHLPDEKKEAIKSRILTERDDSGERKEIKLNQVINNEEAPWLWQEIDDEEEISPLSQALPPDTLLMVNDFERVENALEEQETLWKQRELETGLSLGGFAGYHLQHDQFEKICQEYKNVKVQSLEFNLIDESIEADEHVLNSGMIPLPGGFGAKDEFSSFLDSIQTLEEDAATALVILDTPGHMKRIRDQLLDRKKRVVVVEDPSSLLSHEISPLKEKKEGAIILFSGRLDTGFQIPQAGLRLYSQKDVLGKERSRLKKKSKTAAFSIPVHELKKGQHIVHEDHGIGKFLGLKTVRRGEEVKDFLELSYQKGDKLLIPIDRMDKIQRYSALEGVRPKLDKLGSSNWQKVKSKVKKDVREMAGELINLYAIRKRINGYSFLKDNQLMREFEESFQYAETDDQISAIEDIKVDMESSRPMDRLICGDVGYGKTEVAVRAAFKAAMSGKQTAYMVPTTILARQHYETIKERTRGFGVEVETISRFKTAGQQKEIIKRLSKGEIDILVGTHRILSKDVKFKDLGLLVIDEEQRFGVAHKEKIKQLRKNIDVLSLSATPIPRTLNMGLVGIRDMSLIQTPPKNRQAIQTKVLPYSKEIVRQAIAMELSREGQVFYLRNRIEDIEEVAFMISRLLPEAKPVIAHAKMSTGTLEKVMESFVAGEYNVLVSTTIIENGLDIPQANTLIVERADRFGLSQLYQIRGRVGRSSRSAYAYLLVPPQARMTEDARKRLHAIKEFSDLGSGFRIAAMDLEIRGAGNLLGGSQSGHIEAVGFELYNRILEQSISELKGIEKKEQTDTAFNLGMDIHIPDDYMQETSTRMKYYKEIADAENELALAEIKEEIHDMYGSPPESVEALFKYYSVKLLANGLRIEKIDREVKKLAVKFSQDSEVNSQFLADLVNEQAASFSSKGVLFVELSSERPLDLLEEIYRLLHSLAS